MEIHSDLSWILSFYNNNPGFWSFNMDESDEAGFSFGEAVDTEYV